MKKHFLTLRHSLAACLVAAAALTSCNRAEYAMLPKTSSAYHGTQYTVTAPKPATTPEVAVAPAATPETAPVVAEAPIATPAPTVAVTPAPAATAPQQAKKGVKLNLVQKTALAKINKKADKLAVKITRKSNTTATQAINSNLKIGIVLILVGALITLLPGGIFDLIGGIIAIIGLLFIILALLDMV